MLTIPTHANQELSWDFKRFQGSQNDSSVIYFKQQMLQYSTRSVITTSTLQLYVDYVSLVNSFLPHLPIFPSRGITPLSGWKLTLDRACSTLPNAIANRARSPSCGKREGTSCPSCSPQKGTHHGFAKHNRRQRLRIVKKSIVWRHRGWWLRTFATRKRLMYVDLKLSEGDHTLFQALMCQVILMIVRAACGTVQKLKNGCQTLARWVPH